MKRLLLVLGLVLILSVLTILNVYASSPMPPVLTGQCAGVRFTIAWDEPSVDINNQPLTNLKGHILYFSLNGSENPSIQKRYAATSPKGGGKKTAVVNILMDCKLKNQIRIWVSSINLSGEESVKSNILPLNTTWIEGTSL